jgi:FAD-linked sulfhydryl oxidase
MSKKAGPSSPSPSASTSSMSDMFSASATRKRLAPAAIPATADRSDCPPDTAALGRSTWTFLHTTAAYYPLRASETHQSNMRSLLAALPVLYPCGWCADDFGRDMQTNPPDLSGREGLSRWLCQRHNEVNTKLGKETFECTAEKLGERWKDGPADGRCG